ncbi:MAG: hypothetical protein HND55_14540 [Pseudomonadota bacterium]|nr:MAG: hypothetical protein HND55_14540 [Pseudomonadota bacterium]
MATYRLELDERGEPLLIEESNCISPTPANQWIERCLASIPTGASTMKPALLLAGIMFSQAALAQVSVGWDADCDYNVNTDPAALQTAIDAGHTEIRLSHAQDYPGAIEITQDLALRGGYADCSAANNDQQTNILSTIDAGGLGLTAVKVSGIEQANLLLEYLTITGGDGSADTYPYSGGLMLKSVTGSVNLHHLDLRDNTGGQGGGGLGVYGGSDIEDDQLAVVITETVIRNNSADSGGGVFCLRFHSSFDIHLELSAGTVIQNNHANSQGGALQTNSCRIDHLAGVATHSLNTDIDREIHNNTSNISGAGLTVFGSGQVNLNGTPTQPFDLTGNTGNLDPGSSGQGGAAHVSDGGVLVLTNARVGFNSSGSYGGALYAGFGGHITMRPGPDGCDYDRYCSQLIGNTLSGTAGGGAAVAARYGGLIDIRNSLIWMNNSDSRGYVGHAEQAFSEQAARLLFEGNVIVENGNNAGYSNYSGFELKGGSELTLAYNTLHMNTSNSTMLNQLPGSSLLAVGNIIQEFSNLHQLGGAATTTIDCNLVPSASSIEAPVTDLIEGTVSWLDSGSRDYRLSADDTIAMDVCSDALYSPGADLGEQARGQDNPDVTDLNGSYDLGAHEFDPVSADGIFADAFE